MGRQADMVRDLLLRAVDVLEQRGVNYALCGGWAVALWGYPRMTTDIDIVLAEDELDSACEALREAGFTLAAGKIPLPSQGIWFHRVSALVEDEPVPMNIHPVARDHPYLLNKARAEWQGTSFPVLDIEDLIHMKSKSERGKDKVDVEELRRLRDEKNPGQSGGDRLADSPGGAPAGGEVVVSGPGDGDAKAARQPGEPGAWVGRGKGTTRMKDRRQDQPPGRKVDMSPEAIDRRLRDVAQLHALQRDFISKVRVLPGGTPETPKD